MHPGPGLQTPDFHRGRGLQTPDFQKKSGVPGPRTPDSRFPEKIWSTRGPRLQITDSRIWSPGSRYSRFFPGNLESGDTPDFIWKSGVWRYSIFFGNLESGVWGYSRFFLEIWSLESRPSQNQPSRGQMCGSWEGGGGGASIYIYICIYIYIYEKRSKPLVCPDGCVE